MKKVWENPLIKDLEVKRTSDSGCDRYEAAITRETVNPSDAPYCYCANCDGLKGYDGEMKPVETPCKYAYIRNPGCSA